MPFGSFLTPGEVAKAYQIVLSHGLFVQPLPMVVSAYFQAELAFVTERVAFANSESAICENIVYPILKEVWKPYAEELQLWGHQPLRYNAELSGTPDYFVARRSPLGTPVLDQPYLIVMEAKKDDFEQGWGQCLAAMLAAQRLNGAPVPITYGITTNGKFWEFGQLQNQTFILNTKPYALADLNQLCAAINFMFESCRQQLAVFAKAS